MWFPLCFQSRLQWNLFETKRSRTHFEHQTIYYHERKHNSYFLHWRKIERFTFCSILRPALYIRGHKSQNATRDHFCGATRGISSRKVIFCARSRTCLLKLFIKDFFHTYYKNKIILPLTENRPGAPSNIVSPSFDIAALNPASHTPSLFSK